MNQWIDNEICKDLIISRSDNTTKSLKNKLIIHLPNKMNFSTDYDQTVQAIIAIRKLVESYENLKSSFVHKDAYTLGRVNFDGLTSISTSAALVLTAEISKWDRSIRKRLKPLVENWNDDIYSQFEQLGFFDLFENKPEKKCNDKHEKSDINFVRYIRGKCGNSDETKKQKKELKNEIAALVGNKIDKWTFLHSGLSEAVTNVSHHAYPSNSSKDKSWYLTGSFNDKTKEMKIAFYDQGIGIPNSLHASEVWEKVLSYFSKLQLPKAEQKKHSKLLEAAVKMDRTSTDKVDRGKGLQDLLEFIRQRGHGHLSIISCLGLYKSTFSNGHEKIKTGSFDRSLCGTLIIWSVSLK